jgi:hypothetical protein
MHLEDGRSVTTPVEWYPRLAFATSEERPHFEITGRGRGLHWPLLDKDLSVNGMLSGTPSAEGPQSLKGGQWCETCNRITSTATFTPASTRDRQTRVSPQTPRSGAATGTCGRSSRGLSRCRQLSAHVTRRVTWLIGRQKGSCKPFGCGRRALKSRIPSRGTAVHIERGLSGARERTRTSTSLRTRDPESRASTNSATRANYQMGRLVTTPACRVVP